VAGTIRVGLPPGIDPTMPGTGSLPVPIHHPHNEMSPILLILIIYCTFSRCRIGSQIRRKPTTVKNVIGYPQQG
jgi:hypothetical protein